MTREVTDVLPAEILSARLTLRLVGTEDAAGMLAGRRRVSWHPDYPRESDRDAASLVREDDPDPTWGPRHVVRTHDGLVVGSIGFYGPPTPAEDDVPETEVGFGLVGEARGRGVAREALAALLAEGDRVGVRVRARVRPENRPALRTLAVCGFTSLRGTSEDRELVMVRPMPVAGVAGFPG